MPTACTAAPLSDTSASARSPLSASICPPSRSNGALHRASLSRLATARDVTASASPHRSITVLSSARPRTTSTARPRVAMALRRKIAAAQQRFHQHHRQVGPATAIGMPGRPAPLPMSTTVAPAGISSANDGTVENVPVPQSIDLAGAPAAPVPPPHRPVGRRSGGRSSRADRTPPWPREAASGAACFT